jgi:gamma-glutamyltranspeptidase/glutathione hydrolase
MEPVANWHSAATFFAIVWDPKSRKLYGYNGSGRSPMGRSLQEMTAKVRLTAPKMNVSARKPHSAIRVTAHYGAGTSMAGAPCTTSSAS